MPVSRLLLIQFLISLLISACSVSMPSFTPAETTQFTPSDSVKVTPDPDQLPEIPPIFEENFENIISLDDLFPLSGTRWHGIQLQPKGNLIEISDERSNTGAGSIKFTALPYSGTQASKADIYISGLNYSSGDEIWTEYWVYIEGPTDINNLFIWDLESTNTCIPFQCQSPGRRLYFSGPNGDWLKSDMGKWFRGKDIRQTQGEAIPFPIGEWVRVRVYLSLSSQQDGLLRVWQDNDLILNSEGITLPDANSIYDRVQIGITANGNTASRISLFLDDVKIWDQNPGW